MAITAAQLKADIVASFGATAGGIVAAGIDLWWEMYAGKRRNGAPLLQYWYVMQHAANALITVLHNQAITFSSKSRKVELYQEIENLEGRLVFFADQIKAIEKRTGGTVAGALGLLTTVTPISTDDLAATVGYPDPSDRVYRGDALIGQRSRTD